MKFRALLFSLFAVVMALGFAEAKPVLMISIDGLRPADVIEAGKRGMKLPNLRAFVENGAYASGVRGTIPTVTYPSHTTIITGTWAVKHGVSNNTTFDPEDKNFKGWYWYSSDIKTPTLWRTAKQAGLSTASIAWPVSVGNPDIDYNIPEFWRAGTKDDLKLLDAVSTPYGISAKLGDAAGIPAAAAFGAEIQHDAARTKLAVALITLQKPGFMTLHLVAQDHVQHVYGPGTKEAYECLEATDAMIGELVKAAKAADPETVIAVISDHGFAPVSKQVNLMRPFIDAGLITLDANNQKVASWEAMPWNAGGSSLIVLARPDDEALKAKVGALLNKLAADPENGLAKVLDKEQGQALGGGQEASFFVDYKIGYYSSSSLVSPLITIGKQKGTHGFFPTNPEMRATFMVMGPGVPKKKLGDIDMRAIAPTLAKIMGTEMPSADGKPLF